MSKILNVVLGVIVLVIFGVHFLGGTSNVQLLAEPANTRATITILVCATSAIFGLTILLSALFSDITGDKELLESRFRHAREIFVSFVGILGTIVGFYFGSADKVTAKLSVSARLEVGRVIANAQGGNAPYRFTVKNADKILIENKLSEDGWLTENIGELPTDKSRVTVDVVDTKELRGSIDVMVSAKSSVTVAPVAPAPAPTPKTNSVPAAGSTPKPVVPPK